MNKIYTGETKIYLHPFKEGIISILSDHFAESIVKRFRLEFEVDMYNIDGNKNLQRQKRDNNLVLEIHYKTGPETYEYICDVHSWESREATEYKLLKYITDKYKEKKIGNDWGEEKGKIISKEVLSEKYATQDE